jgi:hypothetical protein
LETTEAGLSLEPSSTTITSSKGTVCLAALSIDADKKCACSYVLMTSATERLKNETSIYCVSVSRSVTPIAILSVDLPQLSSNANIARADDGQKLAMAHLFR